MHIKSVTIAAAAAAILMSAGSGGAMAHDHRLSFGISDHHYLYRPHLYLYSGLSDGCGYYYERWEDTGSFFWKRKYYICKGWW
jgi:hypothetical protein